MSISQEELQKIAQKLSKLPADNPKLLGNISDILQYMELLQELDIEGVTPTVSVVDENASLRIDKNLNPFDTSAKELLGCSEQKVVSNQIVLPNIMK